MPNPTAQVILISGLSGSGKSLALKVLEDSAYYCVDNLPVKFMPQLIGFLQHSGERKIAISVDVRSGETIAELPHALTNLKAQGADIRVIFLEANRECLVKRFSETRRRHPLATQTRTLEECIDLERTMLAEVAELAHRLDTSDVRPNTLRAWIKDFLNLDRSKVTLYFQSFGFKHGIPMDADLVFDVRVLPNPFYDPALRPLTGRDQAVIDFLKAIPEVEQLLDDIHGFVERWLPSFARDNRTSLTVALGCTGGQHRSVYFAEKLAARFSGTRQVLVRHRNLWQLNDAAGH